MAKKKLLKVVVLASTLAFMNCGDSSTDVTNANNIQNNNELSSSSQDNLIPQSTASESSSSAGAESITSSDKAQETPQSSSNAQSDSPASSGNAQASQTSSANNEQANTGSSSSAEQTAGSSNDSEIASSSDAAPAAESSSAQAQTATGIFLAEGTDETKRHLDIEYQEGKGPDGQSVLAYPKQLSTTQKHGIVVWGPGGGEKPGNYPDMIKDLAAQGFVVIGIRESPGDGSLAIAAIDWLDKENKSSGSVFYEKLDLTKVGCSGHSMGGLESEQAAIKDERVITAMLNNSGDRGGGAFKNIPATKTAGVVFGEVGIEHDNAISDYNSATSVPACMIEMTGGPNNGEGGYGHGSGPWDGRALTVAWMRWHLGGEDFRKADFVGTSGKYIDGSIEGHQGKWKGQCKNF